MGLGMIRSFYHSKFELLVRYGIIFWGADNEIIPVFQLQKRVIWSVCVAGRGTSCRQLFKLQKRVICSVCGAGTGTPCRQLFKDCKILTVTSLYVYEVLRFLKKYKSGVQKNKQAHDRNTRTNMHLYIKPCNKILYKKSVIKVGIRQYTKVPINVNKLEEYKPYKRELKSFLIGHAFYSVEEFLCY